MNEQYSGCRRNSLERPARQGMRHSPPELGPRGAPRPSAANREAEHRARHGEKESARSAEERCATHMQLVPEVIWGSSRAEPRYNHGYDV
ncbi:hypothetical protein MRX96_019164 [Rhipicephalus microplus]